MALALYLLTAAGLLLVWSRRLQRITAGAAMALLLLPLIFTGRAMLTGRVYAPLDLTFQYEPLKSRAGEYGIGEAHNIALSDLHCQIIPWQKAVRYALENRQWPLWNPFILCGDILAAAAQPGVYDPVNLLSLVLPLPDAITFGATMTFFLASFLTFAFARSLSCSERAALVAAAGYAFCAMLAFYVGWPLGRSWAFLPLALLGARRVVYERKGGLLTGALVLLIVAGHPETVLHVVAVGAAYGTFEVLRTRAWDTIINAAAAGLLALLLTAVYLLPFVDAMTETVQHEVRTQLYAPQEYEKLLRPGARALRIKQTFVPFVEGDPLNTRVGYLVLLLAAGSLVIARRRGETWFFFGVAVAGFLVTCGIPPLPHLLHRLPLFDIAINERLAFAASFALAILAGLATDSAGRVGALILLALVLIERGIEDGSLYPALPKQAFYPRVPEIASVPTTGLFRVAGTFTSLVPNISTMYELDDARGYQAMTFRRLAQTYPLWSRFQSAWFNIIDDPGRPFLSFLNVRYIFDGTHVIENAQALPRAFVPRSIRYEREAAAVLEGMKGAADFADLAWIEAPEYERHEIANGPGTAIIRRDGLTYEADVAMEGDGWIVISETAWNGWRAYIDGRRVRPHFANHAFLGVYVPVGRHRLRLVYLPEAFTRGRNISLATVALLVAMSIGRHWRRRASSRSGAAGD